MNHQLKKKHTRICLTDIHMDTLVLYEIKIRDTYLNKIKNQTLNRENHMSPNTQKCIISSSFYL
jgi:hypothetical protein